MTATTAKYVRVLWELNAPVDGLETAAQIYQESPELQRVLTDPSVYKEEKHAVVDRIFPEKKLQNFMKILCDYSDVEYLEEIVKEGSKMYANEHQSVVNATLRYVTAPDDNQAEGIKTFLMEEFDAHQVELEMIRDERLVGGFVLTANGREWDWSIQRTYPWHAGTARNDSGPSCRSISKR